jgi:hypothetical protein
MGLLTRIFVAPILEAWRKVMTPPAVPSTDAEMRDAERDIDSAVGDDELEACGKLAVAELTELWKLDIHDPRHTEHGANADRCRRQILDIIRDGGAWSWVTEYLGDGAPNNPQWCGFTAGWGWRKWISAYDRQTWWASCFRLVHWATYRDMVIGTKTYRNLKKPTSGPTRLYAKLDAKSTTLPFPPRVGDILIVGNGDPAHGDHICTVRGFDAERRMFLTVEGNGQGVGPDGKKQHGLVFAERPLGARAGHAYIAMHLIRPAANDLLP